MTIVLEFDTISRDNGVGMGWGEGVSRIVIIFMTSFMNDLFENLTFAVQLTTVA